MTEEGFTGMLKLSMPGVNAKTIPTLLPDHVSRLPPKVLVLLYKLGEPQDLGDLTLLTVKDASYHSSILRMVQWLVHGEYSPFKENSANLSVSEGADKPAVPYEPRAHELNPFLSTTEETHAVFTQEIKLYAFAVVSDFKELQAHVSRKLRTQVPIYAREIIDLLGELARVGVIKQLSDLDAELAGYLSKRIACCRQVLVKVRDLLPFLRGVVDSQEQFMNLIKTSDEARLGKCIEELTKGADPEAETGGLLDSFNKSCLAAKPAEPMRPLPTNGHSQEDSNEATPIRGAESHTVFGAIADAKIVVAPRDGYGTLRADSRGRALPHQRNEDFRFAAGELLLLAKNFGPTIFGSNNFLVRNRLGEVGEVYKHLKFLPVQEYIRKAEKSESSDIRYERPPSTMLNGDRKRTRDEEDLFAARKQRFAR